MEHEEKPQQGKDILVFIVGRDTTCAECGIELERGSFIRLEEKGALCLACADLDHLEYLTSGNTALTRRSIARSRINAKVLKWSHSRKRYERQGILAEPEAIEEAEKDCLADADVRELQRQREEKRREQKEEQFLGDYSRHIRELFPACPRSEEFKIARHACQKYSGRVGRPAASKAFDPDAITLAVQAHVRHAYTKYDSMLMNDWDRSNARDFIRDEVETILERWRRPVSTGDTKGGES